MIVNFSHAQMDAQARATATKDYVIVTLDSMVYLVSSKHVQIIAREMAFVILKIKHAFVTPTGRVKIVT